MNEMLDFVKALAHPQRLRVVGLLAQKTASRAEIAARLNLEIKEAVGHLDFLEQVGAVAQRDGVYYVNDDRLASFAREKLAQERPVFSPSANLDLKSQKILKTFLNPDGSIKNIPAQPKAQAIFEYLIEAFAPNTNYTEKQVNEIIRKYHTDTAGLRRDLVDVGLLSRESNVSRYWRTEKTAI